MTCLDPSCEIAGQLRKLAGDNLLRQEELQDLVLNHVCEDSDAHFKKALLFKIHSTDIFPLQLSKNTLDQLKELLRVLSLWALSDSLNQSDNVGQIGQRRSLVGKELLHKFLNHLEVAIVEHFETEFSQEGKSEQV